LGIFCTLTNGQLSNNLAAPSLQFCSPTGPMLLSSVVEVLWCERVVVDFFFFILTLFYSIKSCSLLFFVITLFFVVLCTRSESNTLGCISSYFCN
jgi:hypothetical protein